MLASPLTILERRGEAQDIEALIDIINQHQVGMVVAGLPILMNGSLGPQAEKTKSFVDKLSGQVAVPVILRDERLSTVSARRLMQASSTKKSKRQAPDDAVAAAVILQSYLDEMPGDSEATP